MKKQRDGREIKAQPPVPSRVASVDWLPFWDGEATPLAEDQARTAQLLREQDSARRARGNASSAETRAAERDERYARIRELHAEDKRTDQILKDAKLIEMNAGKPPHHSMISRALAKK